MVSSASDNVISLTELRSSDGNQPCTTCVKSFAYLQKAHPRTAPAEPECTFDDPDEVALGPKAKIERLEARIGEPLSEAVGATPHP